MVVFRAIGAFFAKIWRWIKETAWIQPLLIVGIIFGVIFSIPSIVKGVQGIVDKISSTESYYHKFEKSLVNAENSEADKLTIAINDVMNSASEENITNVKNTYGTKFFVMYVSASCSSCNEAREGFEEFEKNFNKYATSTEDIEEAKSIKFKLYTIFTDEVTSETTDDETAFVQYMNRNMSFMENAAASVYDSDYYMNGKISDDDLFNVESCDPDEFLTPTIMLVDMTAKYSTEGVRDMMFGVSGSNNVSKAQTLADCWFHKGDFSSK